MSEYDHYVEDYLIHYFRNMKSDLIPRDYELENTIILAGKLEYYLQHNLKAVVNDDDIFFGEHVG